MKSKFCNEVINMKNIKSQRGFILLVAIIACAILAALGVLVFSLSTGDLRTSAATLAEKKALGAVESGFHLLTQSFDPLQANCNLGSFSSWHDVDIVNAPGAQYSISGCVQSPFGPVTPPGFSSEYGMDRYDLQLTGRDTTYKSEISVNLGIAYRPVSLPPVYR
jgi:type II secretory pathway pseudopilin PulG